MLRVSFSAALLKKSDPCPPREALPYSFRVKKSSRCSGRSEAGEGLLAEAVWLGAVGRVVAVTHSTRVPLPLSANLIAWHPQSSGGLPNAGVGDKQICYVSFQLPGNVMIFDCC